MSKKQLYMPILQWKQAESQALKFLSPVQKSSVLPLIELKPDINGELKINDEHKIPESILKTWGDGNPFYFDFTLLFPLEIKIKTALEMLTNARRLRLQSSVLINLADNYQFSSSVIATSCAKENGICLRIVPAETHIVDSLNLKIITFIKRHNIDRSMVDLLIDLKDECDYLTYSKIVSVVEQISAINDFRRLIVSGGSFPLDLTPFKDDEDNIIPRVEWENWKRVTKNFLNREPLFSDYTILHPVPQFNNQNYPGSISVRYTYNDQWWICRGKKANNHPFGSGQYLAHAKTIVQSTRYSGENFSYGDAYIFEKAEKFQEYMMACNAGNHPAGTGNATTWLTAAINHHIAIVVDQLSNRS
jgi:hypothetical protein